MSIQKRKGLGWKRDLPDHRDFIFAVPPKAMGDMPPAFDLRPQCPPVYDQGRIGSCTSNAVAGAIQFDRMKNNQGPGFVPSRLFIYYNGRVMEGDVPYDGGASVRDAVSSVNQQGVCPESDWTYDDTPPPQDGAPFPTGSKPATRPPQSCYDEAVNYDITTYAAVTQNLAQLKGTIYSGFPVIFGFSVYTNWYNNNWPPATTLPLPTSSDSRVGGHAVLLVGYDDTRQVFIMRNSWGVAEADGTPIGDGGYFYMPYAYVTDPNLADDFWVINAVKS